MKKILLMGNPNVGKSVIFSRLTGVDVIASNYPGTTVDFTKGTTKIGKEKFELIDVPGTYSLEPTSKAENVTTKMFQEGDIIIDVIDATNLERNLYLAHELLEKGKPTIIALNMRDEIKNKGIEIDVKKLEKFLGVPVVPTCAVSGEGIKELIQRLECIKKKPSKHKVLSEGKRWKKIGEIVKEVQVIRDYKPSIRDKLAEITVKPTTGIPIALFVIFISFWAVRLIGENLIGYIFEPLFELYRPLVMGMSNFLEPGILHDILIGTLIEGNIEYVESMGLLTTGLFVPFGMVLPYIFAFYLMLSLLEDSGYLPRLATLVDNVFHRLGMHGFGIITVFLGLGCNVPGALSTRTMETRKQRFISATLLSIAVPCMAQIAMIFGILGTYGMKYIAIVFGTLITIYIIFGLILNKFVKGDSPEIFMEIPPYRMPSLRTTGKKTWMRVRWFLKEAIPWLFLGVIIVNILYAIGFFDVLGGVFAPIMEGVFGLPREAALALMIGFLRKDLAIGMLLPLGMSGMQLVIAVTILTIYFPCVATFAVLVKELGVKDMLKSAIIMICTALLVGGIMRIVLIGI